MMMAKFKYGIYMFYSNNKTQVLNLLLHIAFSLLIILLFQEIMMESYKFGIDKKERKLEKIYKNTQHQYHH